MLVKEHAGSVLYQSDQEEHLLQQRLRTNNGILFAFNVMARLKELSVWFSKSDIYPKLIEPARSQQNWIHARMR
jgi:hypothetical protein